VSQIDATESSPRTGATAAPHGGECVAALAPLRGRLHSLALHNASAIRANDAAQRRRATARAARRYAPLGLRLRPLNRYATHHNTDARALRVAAAWAVPAESASSAEQGWLQRLIELVLAHPVLALLTLVFAAGALAVATARGAFFDEAIYLLAGKTLVFRGENWHFETWFVGSPFAFPVLAGVIERLGGGLAAVRLMNVGFLLLAVRCVYGLCRSLRLPAPAALLGAASFGLAGPVLFTGSFATYDMPALAATTLAFWLVVAGTHDARPRTRLLLLAGLTFGVAILVKYIVVAVTPVLFALLAARLMPLERPFDRSRLLRWRTPLLAGLAVLAPVLLVDGLYLHHFWWQLRLVLSYSGGHTTNYGATGLSILLSILLFVAPAWLLALFGLDALRGRGRLFIVGLVLLGGSLVMPLYHIWEVDPLALFKQVGWSLALLAPLDGLGLMALSRRRRELIVVLAALAALTFFDVKTLQQFYPDTSPAATWLQQHVQTSSAPVLADDVWPYRLALSNTFKGREWWVTDQWWWQNQLATPATWRTLIHQGTFSYVVLERGGAFNGAGSVFDASVMQEVQQSGRYRLAESFPSIVSWGNSILPPPFHGQLNAFSTVDTEIWERID
jgi:hypothetical protein